MLADSLARLYARIPLGMRLGLDPMREACARFGHPERAFESVHVAGTNGKGSVCAMVESIARAAGKRTGMFTSPHLCRFAERIQIAGEPLDDATLTATLERALDGAPELSQLQFLDVRVRYDLERRSTTLAPNGRRAGRSLGTLRRPAATRPRARSPCSRRARTPCSRRTTRWL